MLIQANTGSIITYIFATLFVGYLLYSFVKTRRRMKKPPSENVKILTNENFNTTVKSGVSLVDFWAAWCGPCRIVGPIVDEIADELKDEASICKLDVDKNKEIAQRFGIRNIPTIIIFKDGNPIEKIVGIKPKQVLINAVKSNL